MSGKESKITVDIRHEEYVENIRDKVMIQILKDSEKYGGLGVIEKLLFPKKPIERLNIDDYTVLKLIYRDE